MRADTLKPAAKIAFRITGWILSLAAVVFFVRLIGQNGLSVPNRSALQVLIAVLVGAVVYGMAVILLALLWAGLTAPANSNNRTRMYLVSSYLKSQFAKYLPGNIFQYAARHALGRQLGISHGTLASAAIVEALMLICAALLIIALFGMPMLRTLLPWVPDMPWVAALAVLLIIPTLAFLPRPKLLQWLPYYSVSRSTISLFGYVVFFGVFGSLFFAMLTWSAGGRYDAPQIISGGSLAWLVGFAIPGAPAGAGLREAALSLATGNNEPNAEILAAILLFRLATLGGDLLAFVAGWLIACLPRTSSTDR